MNATALLELAPEQIARQQAAIARSSSKHIPLLIDDLIELDRIIDTLCLIVAAGKSRLIEEAQAEAAAAGIKETRGHTWNIKSSSGQDAQIVFPKDKLIPGFFLIKGQAVRYKEDQLLNLADLKGLAGASFDKLFAISYKPAKAFRELAQAVLPPARAHELIAGCEEPSSPRVSFKTK